MSDIASEGEQRALALSFFLAEVAMSEGDGGIVVDDPVSSLDDERRDYIAERLVAETANRQVIVFTHDLPFMLDLLERAEQAKLEPLVQGVWRLGAEVGRVDHHPPFKAMKLKQRIGVLTQEVEQWDKRDPVRDPRPGVATRLRLLRAVAHHVGARGRGAALQGCGHALPARGQDRLSRRCDRHFGHGRAGQGGDDAVLDVRP